MSLVHQGILPEFRTTKATQKRTAKKHLMMGENFGEAIVQKVLCLIFSLSCSLLMDYGTKCIKQAYLY
jgi:hypothetical protein